MTELLNVPSKVGFMIGEYILVNTCYFQLLKQIQVNDLHAPQCSSLRLLEAASIEVNEKAGP